MEIYGDIFIMAALAPIGLAIAHFVSWRDKAQDRSRYLAPDAGSGYGQDLNREVPWTAMKSPAQGLEESCAGYSFASVTVACDVGRNYLIPRGL
jgi:hypothetical protein